MQKPEAVARELETLAATLKRDVFRWLDSGGEVDPIRDAARRQQVLYRTLRREPDLARSVLRELGIDLRRTVTAHLEAAEKLWGLVAPLESAVSVAVAEPAPARALRNFYAEAESSYGVPWYVLAAINFVESRFGRVLGPSAAGALGPMQFLPGTWETYGGGDIMDPRAAILAAARYLKTLGADVDVRSALYAYNRSEAYADAVLIYASEMKADETAFYGYYFWRVIVATKHGDVALG